jgi:sigma-B regulation protein RsbU (phosphoserine phosphatase)
VEIEELASFFIVLGTGEQKLVSSRKRTLRIGRLPESEILIDEPVVSRRHAEIYRSEDRYYLRDAGSRNGTFLNGKRILQAAELSPGDTVTVGNSRIVYEPSERLSLLKEAEVVQPTSSVSLSTPSTPRPRMAPLVLLETVADIARQIVQSKPLESLLDSIIRLCVDKTNAERAAIMLFDEKGALVPRAYYSRCTSTAKFAISRSIASKAIDENQAILIKDVAGDESLSMSDSIASLKIRSAICTPLWNGEKTVGVLYVDTTETDRQFAEIDLLFFSILSGMIAEKIQNAILADIAKEKQRLDAELEIASEIQGRLLPTETPQIPDYDISAFSRPCTEVGGDYFDVIPLGDAVGIAIADVSGKGIGAAMLMSNLQALLRARATDMTEPSALLERMNLDLASRVGEGRFITLFYLMLDPSEGRITYSNAGHNPPYVRRVDGSISTLTVSGIPLGIFTESKYEASEDHLDPGDVLLLYSDGVTECMNKAGDQFGEERLEEVLKEHAQKGAGEIRDAIASAVEGFREDHPSSDDMTLIVLKRS